MKVGDKVTYFSLRSLVQKSGVVKEVLIANAFSDIAVVELETVNGKNVSGYDVINKEDTIYKLEGK